MPTSSQMSDERSKSVSLIIKFCVRPALASYFEDNMAFLISSYEKNGANKTIIL